MPLSIFIRTLFFFQLNVHRWWEKADGRSESDAVLIVCGISSEIICNCFLVCSTFILICNISEFPLIYLHVVVGWEVFNVWCYFLFSCSDEVASNYVWTYENCLWFYMQPSEPIICFPALFFLCFLLACKSPFFHLC